MRQYLAISSMLLLTIVCYANNDKVGHFINISSEVPKSMMISEIRSWELDNPHFSDPNQAIWKREIDYTMKWVRKTIHPILLYDVNDKDFQLLSNLGNKKDDAIMISWAYDQFDFTVVDGRFLALSVCVKNEVQPDVEEVFAKIVDYWYNVDQFRLKASLETLSASDSQGSWGKITSDQGIAAGWYEKPVEWYKAGNEIIFVFEKVCKLPVAKIPPMGKDIFNYFGGIRIDDDRSYLRFEKSNREELSNEYYKKRMSDNGVNNIRTNGSALSSKPNPTEPNQ